MDLRRLFSIALIASTASTSGVVVIGSVVMRSQALEMPTPPVISQGTTQISISDEPKQSFWLVWVRHPAIPMEPVVSWLITSGRDVCLVSWELGSRHHKVGHRHGELFPERSAGWLTAKSAGEIPWRSIQTAASESPIAMATAVLAVGARLSGQTSYPHWLPALHRCQGQRRFSAPYQGDSGCTPSFQVGN